MNQPQSSRSFRHFARHLFLIGKIYKDRHIAKSEVNAQLEKMRKSIIRMNLSYTDINRLSQKIDAWIGVERKYAKFFKLDDTQAQELKKHIAAIEEELKAEREEKFRMMGEKDEEARQLSESLQNVKNKMRHLVMEKAKRQHRLNALEKKIHNKIDVHDYYDSDS